MSVRVGIAIGTNLGDRAANLSAARAALRALAVPGEVFLTASTYRTEPVSCPPGSPYFHNSVVEFGYHGSATDLLERTREIERRLGRVTTTERNAPRIIDVDILYCGGEVIATSELVLPHPRLGERRFVLQPLAEIRPELVLPGQTRTIAEMLAGLVADEPELVVVG